MFMLYITLKLVAIGLMLLDVAREPYKRQIRKGTISFTLVAIGFVLCVDTLKLFGLI